MPRLRCGWQHLQRLHRALFRSPPAVALPTHVARISSAPLSKPSRDATGQARCAASTEGVQRLTAAAPARQPSCGGAALSGDCRAGHAPGRASAVLISMCKGCAAPNSVRQRRGTPRAVLAHVSSAPASEPARDTRGQTSCATSTDRAQHLEAAAQALFETERRGRCKVSQLQSQCCTGSRVRCAP